MLDPTSCATSDPFTDTPVLEEQVYRIWNKDRTVSATVDYEDYVILSRWSWSATKPCKRNRRKVYMRRNRQIPGADVYVDGKRRGKFETIYLHVAVMELTGKKPPTPAHTKVDHRDGDGLHCRRRNLRYATTSQNNRNLHGQHPEDFNDPEPDGDVQSRRRKRPEGRGAGVSALPSGDAGAVAEVRDCPF